VPVIPVAITGTFEAMPYDRKVPKPGRVTVQFGKPLSFERHYEVARDRFVLRSVTDEIMYEIMLMSGQEYVDDYANRFKQPKAEPEAQPATEPATEPADMTSPATPAGPGS
jgi:1-acyl-sn-glycerol-3-phosphate acyltransferase